MAFASKKIFPNDLRPRVAIGFNLPINGESVFRPNFQTKDAIKNNLINYFLTNPGERPGNPNFGAGLREYVFTQISNNDLDFIKEDIQGKIEKEFSGDVLLKDIEINKFPDSNAISITISYDIVNTGINDELELSFS